MSLTNKQKIGNLGEDLACEFLMKHGHKILDRNYRKKWGEIDIVTTKDNVLHFVEVKTVSHETEYMPEDNIHPWKRKRLARAVQTYLLEKNSDLPADEEGETEWQTDSLAVFLNFQTRKAKFRLLENIIL